MKKITIHAGHNKPYSVACGAVGYLDESKECRDLVPRICKCLKEYNVKSKDITVNDGTSQIDVLQKLVKKANATIGVDLHVSVHMNSFKKTKKDGKTKGCEVLICGKPKKDSLTYRTAKKICRNLEYVGFTNRGVKYVNNLYFLNNTKKQAILIEVCFCDDFDDCKLFKEKKNMIAEVIAEAIAEN